MIKTMIAKIPINETTKSKSAILSRVFSFFKSLLFNDIKDKTLEQVKKSAITEVNSSIKEFAVLLLICKDVITNKQKPRRFAAVDNMC